MKFHTLSHEKPKSAGRKSRWAAPAGALFALMLPAGAQAGVTVSVTSKPSSPSSNNPGWAGTVDTGGNTSVANDTNEVWRHSSSDDYGYFATEGQASSEKGFCQRDRDLGMVFKYNGTTGRKIDYIVVRTGFGDKVVRTGMWGQTVSIQLFSVSGTPSLNTNGTNTYGKHGYPHGPATNIPDHRDDYVTGLSFTSLATGRSGTFPSSSAFGCSGTPDPNASCLKGKYLKFDLTNSDEISLTNGQRYAFLLMIDNHGSNRGFTLANRFDSKTSWSSTAMMERHGIRREGNGSMPPAQAYSSSDCTNSGHAAYQSANFSTDWTTRIGRSPGTNGYPDVDTWRDFEFYVVTK
jgi:hypothetical protein